jgi:hypothetical protein
MRNILKISFASVAALSLLFGDLGRPASAAGTATFSLTPASGSYTVGNTVSVQIWENSGTDNVNGAQVKLSYPSALTYLSVVNGSHWDIVPGTSVGGGTVTIVRAHCESPGLNQPCVPLSGSSLIATVNFKAASAGSAAVNFVTAENILYRTSDNGAESLSFVPASYTISAPATTPTGSGSTGGSTGSTSSTPKTTTKTSTSTPKSTTSTPTNSSSPSSSTTTAPTTTISSIQVKNLSDKTATITWKTSVPTTSEVNFGTDTHYGFVATDNTLTKDHSVVLDPSYLLGDKTYHYQIKSVDANGKVTISKDATFRTQLASAAKPVKSNGVWVAVAALLLVAAAGVVGFGYMRHFRFTWHHGTAAAGGAGMSAGTPVMPHHTPIVVNPESKDTVIKPTAATESKSPKSGDSTQPPASPVK